MTTSNDEKKLSPALFFIAAGISSWQNSLARKQKNNSLCAVLQ